jgi:hypothetical protein
MKMPTYFNSSVLFAREKNAQSIAVRCAKGCFINNAMKIIKMEKLHQKRRISKSLTNQKRKF